MAILLGAICLGDTGATSFAAGAKTVFIDLDGDGFDDNASDQDNDGTPDLARLDTAVPQADSTVQENLFAAGLAKIEHKPVFLTNSGAFSYLKRVAAAPLQSRGGFGSGGSFGPGNDIGSGAVLGGVCEGGVCH